MEQENDHRMRDLPFLGRGFFSRGWAAVCLLSTMLIAHGEARPDEYLDMSLEQLMQIPVYAASKHEQSAKEAPSSVTIITADEIKRYGYRTIADLLRAVPSFHVSLNRGSSGFIGARGINRTTDYGARFLLQVDGHRLTEPVYGGFPNQQDFPLDLDLIDRVEIVRGPGSSLHGSNAFFGVVNVVTRRAKDFGGAEAALSTGSLGANSARLSYGAATEAGIETLFSGSLYGGSGDRDLYFRDFDRPGEGMDGHARNIDADHAGTLFGGVSYKDFRLSAGYANRNKQIPSGRYGAIFGDSRSANREKRANVAAEYGKALPSGWELSLRGSFDSYLYEANIPLVVTPVGATIVYKNDINAHWLNAEVLASRLFAQRHRVSIGGEYQMLSNFDAHLYYAMDEALLASRYLNNDLRWSNYGLFVQDEFRCNDRLILNMGVRMDDYDTFGETVNPRLGLIYSPWRQTTFKLLYGRAFRAPTISEMFYQRQGDSRNINPALDPEKITTYEMIWEQGVNEWLHSSLSLYRNEIDNIIEFLPENDLIHSYAYGNMGQATVHGMEATLELRRQGLRGRFSYAYADVQRKEATIATDNAAKHLLKANLIIPLDAQERYTLGLEGQYVSSRQDVLGDKIDPYWIFNGVLFAQPLNDRLDVSVGIYNLFDERYVDPSGSFPFQTEQDGRTARLKLTYRFQ